MLFYFFFFKEKTAYEMRISDLSSDVCSSDLQPGLQRLAGNRALQQPGEQRQAADQGILEVDHRGDDVPALHRRRGLDEVLGAENGRRLGVQARAVDRAAGRAPNRIVLAVVVRQARGHRAGARTDTLWDSRRRAELRLPPASSDAQRTRGPWKAPIEGLTAHPFTGSAVSMRSLPLRTAAGLAFRPEPSTAPPAEPPTESSWPSSSARLEDIEPAPAPTPSGIAGGVPSSGSRQLAGSSGSSERSGSLRVLFPKRKPFLTAEIGRAHV